VRNAGQVIADSILGSLEYSVEVLGVPLIMVLGHDECGAIRATIDATEGKLQARGNFIKSIVSQIEPTVQEANKRGMHHIDDVTALHIEETINDMITRSEIIAEAVTNGSLGIVGANYKLALGEIHPLFMVGELK
jgi:carbonic anhydrase